MVRADDERRKRKKLEMKQQQIREMMRQKDDDIQGSSLRQKDDDIQGSSSSVNFSALSQDEDDHMNEDTLGKMLSAVETKAITESTKWTELIEDTLEGFEELHKENSWPTQTLFTYLRTLMKLQETNHEFTELNYLAGEDWDGHGQDGDGDTGGSGDGDGDDDTGIAMNMGLEMELRVGLRMGIGGGPEYLCRSFTAVALSNMNENMAPITTEHPTNLNIY